MRYQAILGSALLASPFLPFFLSFFLLLSPPFLLLPFFFFSLFKKSAGHTGRYLYLGCFLLLYLAAVFYSRLQAVRWRVFACITALYLAVFIGLLAKEPLENPNRGYLTAAAVLAAAILVYGYAFFMTGGSDKLPAVMPSEDGQRFFNGN